MSTDDTNKNGPKDYQEIDNPAKTSSKVLEAKWAQIKKDYHKKYPFLEDKDLNYWPGEFEKMTSLIATKTERSRAEVHNEIRYWEV